MKAMILAAGEGRRMRPLTLNCPKPLLQVAGKSLIEHHLSKLQIAGFSEVVINVAYLGQQIIEALGNGESYGLKISYSVEAQPLETAGGLLKALDLLGGEPFALVNGDVWCDFPYEGLRGWCLDSEFARLLLVPNPEHHRQGDFVCDDQRVLGRASELSSLQGDSKENTVAAYTYSGLAVIDPQLLLEYPHKREVFGLAEVLFWAIEQQALGARIFDGYWLDVGTPERLQQLSERLTSV